MVDIVETHGTTTVTIMTHGTMFLGNSALGNEILLSVTNIPDLITALTLAKSQWDARQAELAAAEPAFREAA